MKEFTRDFVKENGMDIFVGGTNTIVCTSMAPAGTESIKQLERIFFPEPAVTSPVNWPISGAEFSFPYRKNVCGISSNHQQ